MDQRITIVFAIIIIYLLFININNLVHFENFDQKNIMNKTYFDTYIDYNKKIYEYIFNKKIPERQKNNNITATTTLTEYYEKINSKVNDLFETKKCGFKYNYYEEKSLVLGSMYITESSIEFTNGDINNNTGLYNSIDNNITIIISDGEINYQITKNKYTLDPTTGVITLYVDLNTFESDFFNTNKQYVIYPCLPLEKLDNVSDVVNPEGGDYGLKRAIVDNNINVSFSIFLITIACLVIIYNWKYLYSKVIGLFDKKIKDSESCESITPQLYYNGGYDFKDYSE